MNKWTCLKLGTKPSIAGIPGSPVNKYLYYQVFPCKNTTLNNNKCAPQ